MKKHFCFLFFVSALLTTSIFAESEEKSTSRFKLASSSTAKIVTYSKYGKFQGVGTKDYKYTIKDYRGLAKAVGEGIYPNKKVYQDPIYKKLLKQGKLEGSPWEFVAGPDYEKNFYKWASLEYESGVKLFFTALALNEAGLSLPAIKAFYAAVIHFPGEACWAKDASFVWYIGPAAISEIKNITRQHPELGLELQGAAVVVQNAYDVDLSNDVVIVNPGKFIAFNPEERKLRKYDLSQAKVIQRRGSGKVQVVQYDNGHWQLLVNGKPFFVKGLTFLPTPVGRGPDDGSLNDWMNVDTNKNNINDIAYETWIDKNGNNKRDPDEKTVGDFKLLQEMGANAVRVFYDEHIDKELLRKLHQDYGVYVIMCNFIGAYTVGSGASWEQGTDYTNKEHKKNMKQNVTEMVLAYKDEPFILMWLLGNENNLSADYSGINTTRTNASRYPEEYAKFLNEMAALIHKLDPDHPVATGNLQLRMIDLFNKYCPELDILGVNSYRGKEGFGSLWEEVKVTFDRPVIITEFGCDAYWEGKGEDELAQSNYHKNCWYDINYNTAAGWGQGNSIGGIVFEWLDEWWKDNVSGDPASHQQTVSQGDMNFPDGRSHEEWFGICSQGNGKHSPFLRRPRQAYYLYKDLWQE